MRIDSRESYHFIINILRFRLYSNAYENYDYGFRIIELNSKWQTQLRIFSLFILFTFFYFE